MVNFKTASSDEMEFVDGKLTDYNIKAKPLHQEEEFVAFKHVAEVDGQVIGGILGYSSFYKIGYIETLWVDESHRRSGIGSELLNLIETDLKEFGCKVVHLETFDFQGPEFYRENGYEEFGKLFYPNADLHEYFLKKEFV